MNQDPKLRSRPKIRTVTKGATIFQSNNECGCDLEHMSAHIQIDLHLASKVILHFLDKFPGVVVMAPSLL